MISNQIDTSEISVHYDAQTLSADESFFLELFQKKDKQTINIRYTPKGIQTANLEPFINYYSEAEIFLLLESLVSKRELMKNEKGVVLLCPKCGNHANMPVLLCPQCGSTRLGKKEDIHHHECGYWGPREEFINGMTLQCPKCGVFLDFEADEGASGHFSVGDPYFECQDCVSTVSKNDIILVCIKCNNRYMSSEASFLSSVTYSLASEEDKLRDLPPKNSLGSKTIQAESMQKLEIKIPVTSESSVNLSESNRDEVASQEMVLNQEAFESQKPEIEIGKQPELEQEKRLEKRADLEPEKEPESVSFDEPVDVSEKIEASESNNNIDEFDSESFGVEFFQKSMRAVSDIFSRQRRKLKTGKDLFLAPDTDENSFESNMNMDEPVEESLPNETGLEIQEVYEDSLEVYNEKSEEIVDKPSHEHVNEAAQEEVYEEQDLGIHQVLLIIEDVTTSELIIESLEEANKPINVLHVDNAFTGLKELRHRYDAIIIDLELKTLNYDFVLSEMEKWSITIPLIVISNDVNQEFLSGKFALNIEAVFKKKQKDYKKLPKTLIKVLEPNEPP